MRRVSYLHCGLVLLCIAVLFVVGCGGKESQGDTSGKVAVTDQKAVAPTAPTPATPPAPAKPEFKLETGKQALASALRLAPASAMVATATPKLTLLPDKAIPLAKRLAKPELVDEEVGEALAEAAKWLNVPDAKTLPDIAKAVGIDPEMPVAVFVDASNSLAAMQEGIKRAKELQKAEPPAVKAEPLAPPAAPAEKPAGASEKEDAAPAPAPEHRKTKPEMKFNVDMEEATKDLPVPHVALVAGVADAAKLEAAIKEGLKKDDIDPAGVKTVEASGTTINDYGKAGAYAIVSNAVVAGTSAEFVKAVLDRTANPADIPYGTADFPESTDSNALAALVFMDKLMPALDVIVAMGSDTDAMAPAVKKIMEKYRGVLASGKPGVQTLDWSDDQIVVKGLIDLPSHPGLKELTGDPSALRVAQFVPDSTVLLLSSRFNDVEKKAIVSDWVEPMAGDPNANPMVGGMIEQVKQVVGILGDEAVIAVAKPSQLGELFSVYAMIAFSDVAKAKEMIEQFAPGNQPETYNGATIAQLPVPSPLPVYIAYAKDIVILTNSKEGVKTIIDMDAAGGKSKFFSELKPAFDADKPAYGMFLLKTDLIKDVVLPYAPLMGLPMEAIEGLNKVVGVIGDLRVSRDTNGSWVRDTIALNLKPAAPAPEAAPAPASEQK